MDLLLRSGAYPNITNNQGRSALHLASEAGTFETTQVLLNSGANASLKDATGMLPVDLCTQSDVESLLRTSVQQGSFKTDHQRT